MGPAATLYVIKTVIYLVAVSLLIVYNLSGKLVGWDPKSFVSDRSAKIINAALGMLLLVVTVKGIYDFVSGKPAIYSDEESVDVETTIVPKVPISELRLEAVADLNSDSHVGQVPSFSLDQLPPPIPEPLANLASDQPPFYEPGLPLRTSLGEWVPIKTSKFRKDQRDRSRHRVDRDSIILEYSSSVISPIDFAVQQGAFIAPILSPYEIEDLTLSFTVIPGDNERVYHLVSFVDADSGFVELRNNPAVTVPKVGIGILIVRSGSEYQNSTISIYSFSGSDWIEYENQPPELLFSQPLGFQLKYGVPMRITFSVSQESMWRVVYSDDERKGSLEGTLAEAPSALSSIMVSGIEAGLTFYGNSVETVVFRDFKVSER